MYLVFDFALNYFELVGEWEEHLGLSYGAVVGVAVEKQCWEEGLSGKKNWWVGKAGYGAQKCPRRWCEPTGSICVKALCLPLPIHHPIV